MRYRLLSLTGLAVAVAAAPLPAALGAEQGQISDTQSTGTVDLSLEVPPLVQISELDDIDLGIFGGAAMAGTDDVCVWSTTRGYTLTASGDGGGFNLTGDVTNTSLAYSVEWAETGGATSGTSLAAGTGLAGLTTSATSPDCNAGTNPTASVIVEVSDTDLGAAPTDTYTGTLTLVVAPE
jgi:hypothetical protein